MGRNLGMFKKGMVLIAIPFFFQMVFVGALLKFQAESARAQSLAIHTKDVMSRVELISRRLSVARGGVRWSIYLGDDEAFRDYQQARATLPDELARLRDLVSDNKGQTRRARELTGIVNADLAWLAETLKIARGGDKAAAVARLDSADRRRATESSRDAITEFLRVEEDLDTGRLAQEQSARNRLGVLITVGASVSVLVGLVMVWAFSQGFARRVEVLGDNARRLAEGKPLAEPIGGTDEIGRLDAAFHGMARSLADKDQENEMFIYSVSHDLRSPLVNLQGFARELALTCDDLRVSLEGVELPAKTRERVETLLTDDMGTSIHFIRNAVTRLSSIIDSLLRLSRAGRVLLAREPVDVRAAVGRVVEALGATIAENKVDVVVNDLPPALGDMTATEQVFANLVGNAVKYLDPGRPGRVEIGASCDEDPRDEAREQDDRVPMREYYVRDNGLGIPGAYHSKLFLAFQRLHPHVAPGEGIGLALVRRMVERQGGKVRFDSEEGRGSTFFVTLPAAPAVQAEPEPKTT